MTAAADITPLEVTALPTVCFVGGGHMAASLIGGLLAAGLDRGRIRVAQRNAERAQALRLRFEIEVVADAATAVSGAAIVVLAVKPQQMAQALTQFKLAAGTTVISVAAGVRVASFARRLPGCSIIRAMPNTPALLRAGISGLYAPADTSATACAQAQTLLAAAGEVCWVDSEAQLDALTAVSGCGPAYYFKLTEVLRAAGTALGLDAAVSARLALQTFIGAARMAQAASEDVAVLRQQVTSKGGATEAALAVLESADLSRIFEDALRAAEQRSRERGDDLERSTSL
ncbi:MAG: pyrroline-5-carboxylate reductase [Nevskia sp.]|nr:pyrroline-5-carboxylate reductase [Nevskia sp.]